MGRRESDNFNAQKKQLQRDSLRFHNATATLTQRERERERETGRHTESVRERDREGHAVTVRNKCFAIIQPQNSYFGKTARRRRQRGGRSSQPQWR